MEVLRYDSWHDPLTGLFDRRSFDRLLEMSVARSLRYHWPFTLVVIDLDGLKQINDTTGMPPATPRSRRSSERFRRVLRFGDNAARIGGDEFAVILPNTDPDDVPMLLERIGSSQLGDRPCPAFSYGVAQCPAEADDIESLFKLADSRLYEAKSERRASMNVDDLELELRKLPGVRAAGFTERDDVLLIQLQVSGETSAAEPAAAGDTHRVPPLREAGRARGRALAGLARAARPRARSGHRRSRARSAAWPASSRCPNRRPRHRRTPAPEPVISEQPSIAAALEPEPNPNRSPSRRRPRRNRAARGRGAGAPADRIERRDNRVRLLAVLTFPDTDELEVHLTFEGRRIIGRAVASNGILGVVEAMVDGLKVFVPRLRVLAVVGARARRRRPRRPRGRVRAARAG